MPGHWLVKPNPLLHVGSYMLVEGRYFSTTQYRLLRVEVAKGEVDTFIFTFRRRGTENTIVCQTTSMDGHPLCLIDGEEKKPPSVLFLFCLRDTIVTDLDDDG